jgi:hypothetical protein
MQWVGMVMAIAMALSLTVTLWLSLMQGVADAMNTGLASLEFEDLPRAASRSR